MDELDRVAPGLTIQPIMFVLLFVYVFGGAIDPSGGGAAYREFLIAGIFAQTVVFGATNTGAPAAGKACDEAVSACLDPRLLPFDDAAERR